MKIYVIFKHICWSLLTWKKLICGITRKEKLDYICAQFFFCFDGLIQTKQLITAWWGLKPVLSALKQPRSVCQLPGRAQIKLSITGRVYGNYMFVNMLEKCVLGSSSVCSEKQFCSEITFQMDEGDPHQITDMRGVFSRPVLVFLWKSPNRRHKDKSVMKFKSHDILLLIS